MKRYVWLVMALGALALPSLALGHAERPAYFPDHRLGSVPKYRTSGPSLVVCKRDSRARILRSTREKQSQGLRARNLRLLGRCRFRHIQAAVNAARNRTRILVLPGVYKEEPSRRAPSDDPRCDEMYSELETAAQTGEDPAEGRTPSYRYQRTCPNAKNLIAIVGDDDDRDKRCDDKCSIQIEGTGRRPQDVVIRGAGFGERNGSKLNLIRADRADGVVLRNFLIEYSDFNNIYVLETNGFRVDRVLSRWSREYGVLSFTSDNGVYDHVRAHGNGDSGIYPGSGPEGRCKRYGIEVRHSESWGNTIGWSGSAGNGVWTHHSKFHHNSTGITMDSFASGHPGSPQDCSKWEDNQVYSNNAPLFEADRDEYCARTPVEKRDPRKVCPSFQVPVGTGILTGGGNRNIFRRNRIWDNWRRGTMLFWVPGAFRGEDETGQSAPNAEFETSHGNRYVDNIMGVDPRGRRDPNGVDFWWDDEGRRNCWSENVSFRGRKPTSDPPRLPGCPRGSIFGPTAPAKFRELIPCATWDPETNPDPPGCNWFRRPREPK